MRVRMPRSILAGLLAGASLMAVGATATMAASVGDTGSAGPADGPTASPPADSGGDSGSASTAAAGLVASSPADLASPAAAQSSPSASVAGPADVPVLTATTIRIVDAFDADQGVAVDRDHFYAVDNSTITKHDRRTGEPVAQFAGDSTVFQHFDSGAIIRGRLYAAHSNYPKWPMTSSIEILDPRTMRHIGTHSFGIDRGSMTWIDYQDGYWWGGFANYDKIQRGMTQPYGETRNTQVVQMDHTFQVVQAWTIPQGILERFSPMSNSGGSWGPDGRLYLTGHDASEAYVMELPEAGSELRWVATIALPDIEGQGIAWDRSDPRHPTLWGVSRQGGQVVQFDVPYQKIPHRTEPTWQVLGPGAFQD